MAGRSSCTADLRPYGTGLMVKQLWCFEPFPRMPTSASMVDDPLKTLVQFVRGVGPERMKLLANLRIVTVEDLLWNLPRDVLDLTNVRRAAELRTGELQTV